jgi:glucose-1-phosphate thymidylyltransferase
MKGLILAAGFGTRLRPLTSLRPKPFINVANKALVRYAIDSLIEAGISNIGIVVNPENHAIIANSLESYTKHGFHFIIQDPPRGLAHAVKVSQDFLADDPFVMYLSDNLFQHGITDFVTAFDPEQGTNAVLALIQVADASAFGVATVNQGRITQLIEKPEQPESNLAVAGVYVFDKEVHKVIATLQPGAKGEYQITDAIQIMIEQGRIVKPVEVKGWWKDTGKPEDILDANRLVLDTLEAAIEGELVDVEITGEVVIEAGARVSASKLIGPVMIAKDAVVSNATIGPHVSLGEGVRVERAQLSYSVIEANTQIINVAKPLGSCLIGQDVTISHSDEDYQSFILGDKTRLTLV